VWESWSFSGRTSGSSSSISSKSLPLQQHRHILLDPPHPRIASSSHREDQRQPAVARAADDADLGWKPLRRDTVGLTRARPLRRCATAGENCGADYTRGSLTRIGGNATARTAPHVTSESERPPDGHACHHRNPRRRPCHRAAEGRAQVTCSRSTASSINCVTGMTHSAILLPNGSDAGIRAGASV
jgi:hypothetical protein